MSELLSTETVVQRFRPYCCHAHGGHDGQVRINSTGMYVRWQDYERLREALETLLPGLMLDLRYAEPDDDHDALRARIRTVTEALSGRTDWEPILRGTSTGTDCNCYGYQGDNTKCPQHGAERREVCEGCGNLIDPNTCGCGSPIDHSSWEGHQPVPMGCDCMREKESARE